VVDEELCITVRRVFAEPTQWGYVLADITRRLAAIYAAESEFTEAEVGTAITDAFGRSLRSGERAVRASPYSSPHPGKGRDGPKPAKSARPRAKARAKSSTKAIARRKPTRVKP